jgi:hypothetical protein
MLAPNASLTAEDTCPLLRGEVAVGRNRINEIMFIGEIKIVSCGQNPLIPLLRACSQ